MSCVARARSDCPPKCSPRNDHEQTNAYEAWKRTGTGEQKTSRSPRHDRARLAIASLGSVAALPMQRLQTDMSAPESAKLIEQDMDDVKALKILQTPTFYVNGKLLQPFGVEAFLVRNEVKALDP